MAETVGTAVQAVFEYKKIESVLEDYALGQYILDTRNEKPLSVKESIVFCRVLHRKEIYRYYP